MKQIIFLTLIGLIFLRCVDDNKESNSEQDPKGLVFEITARAQTYDTKAGSPIYSQDAVQNITRVTIFAFKSNGTDYLYQKQYEFSTWTLGATSGSFTVPEADKLPEGDYQFLAVGRDATDLYQILPTPSATTTMEDMNAVVAASGDEYEIFAGTATAQVYSEGARVSITITRKIAGILGYFKNVPAVLDGNEVLSLRLTASAGNKMVNLSTGEGSAEATAYDIINIDLSTQAVENGIYVGNDLTANGIVKLENSQLGGSFMLPVNGITLTLGLYGTGNIALKTWQVNEGGNITFNIEPNHFYSLGTKYKPDTTTGVDPTDPGDDDNAIDLLQDQVITITIDPAWSTIHSLVLQ